MSDDNPYGDLIGRLLDPQAPATEQQRHDVIRHALGHILESLQGINEQIKTNSGDINALNAWRHAVTKAAAERINSRWRWAGLFVAGCGAAGAFLGALTGHISLH